jgi:hypothetical protein
MKSRVCFIDESRAEAERVSSGTAVQEESGSTADFRRDATATATAQHSLSSFIMARSSVFSPLPMMKRQGECLFSRTSFIGRRWLA